MAGRAGAHRHRQQPGLARAVVFLASVLVLAAAAGTATWSAWSAQTANEGNTFTAGTVRIGDDDASAAMFALTGMKPGVSTSRCISVDYSGTLPAAVRLYGAATAGTGAEAYLTLTVTRGVSSPAVFSDCTNFTADTTDYASLGGGVLYSGLLSGYPTTWAGGIADPTAAWTTSETHTYRFTVDVANNDAAQGKSVTQNFTWEAR